MAFSMTNESTKTIVTKGVQLEGAHNYFEFRKSFKKDIRHKGFRDLYFNDATITPPDREEFFASKAVKDENVPVLERIKQVVDHMDKWQARMRAYNESRQQALEAVRFLLSRLSIRVTKALLSNSELPDSPKMLWDLLRTQYGSTKNQDETTAMKEVLPLSKHGRALISEPTRAFLEARHQSTKAGEYFCNPELLPMVTAGMKDRRQRKEPSGEFSHGRNLLESEYEGITPGSELTGECTADLPVEDTQSAPAVKPPGMDWAIILTWLLTSVLTYSPRVLVGLVLFIFVLSLDRGVAPGASTVTWVLLKVLLFLLLTRGAVARQYFVYRGETEGRKGMINFINNPI